VFPEGPRPQGARIFLQKRHVPQLAPRRHPRNVGRDSFCPALAGLFLEVELKFLL
jgi:hypothetical protein